MDPAYEEEPSTQPEVLALLLEDAISCFASMVEDETSGLREHAAAAATKEANKAMTEQELQSALPIFSKKAKGAAKARRTASMARRSAPTSLE